jgi:hypothetical protein
VLPRTLVFGAAIASAVAAQAQQFIYPAKGQSVQQQQHDQGDCYAWAKGQTGVDPAAGPVAVASPQQHGGGARGVARGAVGGAIIADATGGDADGGAAAGALIGGIRGAARQQRANEQTAANAQAAVTQQFQRAYGACLEGRGYTVK